MADLSAMADLLAMAGLSAMADLLAMAGLSSGAWLSPRMPTRPTAVIIVTSTMDGSARASAGGWWHEKRGERPWGWWQGACEEMPSVRVCGEGEASAAA